MNHIKPSEPLTSPERLRFVPVQCMGIPEGVILSRGCAEVQISGEGVAEMVEALFTATGKDGANRGDILANFPEQERPQLDDLIDQLLARRFLIPVDSDASPDEQEETSLDVFHWNFGTNTAEVGKHLSTRNIAVLGVNCISRQLARALLASGHYHLAVVDHPLMRNLRMFAGDELHPDEWPASLPRPLAFEEWRDRSDLEALDCVVATTDFGGQALMRSWNEFCVVNHCTFLPVVLDKLTGYVGPLVVPGETACYECLWSRENANRDDYLVQRTLQQPTAAVQRQVVNGFHPSMASILGDMAAVELHKFYSMAIPYQVGTLFEVNLLYPRLQPHKVLKLPRCPVCSPLRKHSSVNPNKPGSLPGHDLPRSEEP